jgi:hypothetical protein
MGRYAVPQGRIVKGWVPTPQQVARFSRDDGSAGSPASRHHTATDLDPSMQWEPHPALRDSGTMGE